MSARASFARRWNRDSSIDSICPVCYRAVATAHTEDELQQAELQHSCDSPADRTLRARSASRMENQNDRGRMPALSLIAQ
jgi:hypothetical protein